MEGEKFRNVKNSGQAVFRAGFGWRVGLAGAGWAGWAGWCSSRLGVLVKVGGVS